MAEDGNDDLVTEEGGDVFLDSKLVLFEISDMCWELTKEGETPPSVL